MAVANALGQRGSKCVTAAPWKSPMMAWRTVCDDYFRVADHPPASARWSSNISYVFNRVVRSALATADSNGPAVTLPCPLRFQLSEPISSTFINITGF